MNWYDEQLWWPKEFEDAEEIESKEDNYYADAE